MSGRDAAVELAKRDFETIAFERAIRPAKAKRPPALRVLATTHDCQQRMTQPPDHKMPEKVVETRAILFDLLFLTTCHF